MWPENTFEDFGLLQGQKVQENWKQNSAIKQKPNVQVMV